MQHIGHPLLGDTLYGRAPARLLQATLQQLWSHPYPALHAAFLRFEHPVTYEAMTFLAPVPAAWEVLGLPPLDVDGVL
jgi:23S rRNA pseudouridine1911/1915/1917 synthase